MKTGSRSGAGFGKASALPFFLRPNQPARKALLCVLLAINLVVTGCDSYPRDTSHTLQHIRQKGELRVGVISNPPWVIHGENGPTGVEPEIVRRLADQLGARVSWHWGSTGVLVQALEQYQVDLVVGGLTTGPRLPKTVAATKPYYTARYTVGLPPGAGSLSGLEGRTIAITPISPLHKALRDKGAELRPMDSPDESDLPIAGPVWRLKAQGYIPGRWQLLTEKHVMVVAKGENAWMNTLQRFLNQLKGLDEQLQHFEVSR